MSELDRSVNHPISLMSGFLDKINRFIIDNALLDKSDALHLIALSGGADSVCLLLILKLLGYKVEAIHCNFKLRGAESDRDEKFCRELCEKNDIPFHIVRFDTLFYAETHKVSIEMAARELRYDYFERLRNDIGAADICVAHHKDDSVETLLLNLVRGTGIHGLQGIKPLNGKIVRPLLCVSREEIVDWLKLKDQSFVTDSSNLKNDVMRNKIRLDIIPLLKTINPSVCENIHKTALRMVEAGKVFDDALDNQKKCVVSLAGKVVKINTITLYSQPSPEYLLYTILSPYGFSSSQIEDIFHADLSKSGLRWTSDTHVLVTDRDSLLLKEKDGFVFSGMKIPESGTYVFSEDGITESKVRLQDVAIDDDFIISREKECVCLDASKVRYPLLLRKVEQGDRFVPFGMKGSKLVSDFLTDRKKNVFEKDRQLVLADATGAILWLVGERPDGRFCISSSTIKSLVVRYIHNE